MVKRFFSLIMVVCIMAGILSVPASAEYTSRAVDDFETGNVGAIATDTGYGDYYYSSTASGLFVHSNKGKHPTYSKCVEIVSGGGYNSSTGLKLALNSQSVTSSGIYRPAWVETKQFSLGANDSMVLSFKVKFATLPTTSYDAGGPVYRLGALPSFTGGAYISGNQTEKARTAFYVGSDGYFYDGRRNDAYTGSATTKKAQAEEGVWYTVVTKLSGAGRYKTMESYILNEAGEVYVTSEAKPFDLNDDTSNEYKISLLPLHILNQQKNATVLPEAYVDDACMTIYSTQSPIGFDTLRSDIANGAIEIPVSKSLKLAFDQKLGEGAIEKVKLYKKSDENKTDIAYDAQKVTFDSFVLNPSADLDGNTEYVIDASAAFGVGNVVGGETAKITFITLDPTSDPVTLTKITLNDGSELTQNATDVKADAVFTLTFDKKITAPQSGVHYKVYKTGDETAVIGTTITKTEDKSFTFKLNRSFVLGTGYTIDLSGILSALGGSLIGTKSYSFTSQTTRDSIYLVDDLESATAGTKGSAYESTLLNKSSDYITIENGIGVGGSKGIRVNNMSGGTAFNFTTKQVEFDRSERLYFECKIKFEELGTTGYLRTKWVNQNNIQKEGAYSAGMNRFRADGDGITAYKNNGANPFTIKKGAWYTLLYEIRATEIRAYILDEDNAPVRMWHTTGTDNVFYGSGGVASTDDYATAGFRPLSPDEGGTVNAVLDDFKLYRVSETNLSLLDTYSTVAGNGSSVLKDESIVLTFNRPLGIMRKEAEKAVSLLKGSDKVDAEILRTGANEITICPKAALAPGESYQIQFADTLKALNYAGKNVSNISLTATNKYPVRVTGTTLTFVDGAIKAGSYGFSVTSSSSLTNATALLAVYNRTGMLLGIEKASVNVVSGDGEIEIQVAKDYANASYAELMLFDSLTTLNTKMHNYRVNK